MFYMKNSSFDISNGSSPAVVRAARVLQTVASSQGTPGISEIGRRAGLSKSTVHALVGALLQEGLLARVDGKGYRLGPTLIELGSRARNHHVLDVANGELQRLSLPNDETVFFGCRSADRVQVLARRESPRLLTLSAPLGSHLPLLAGALGKAYLAGLRPESAARFLEDQSLPRYTDRSVVEPDIYLAQVREAAERGFALDRGEYLAGVLAAASSFTWLGGTYFVWAVGIDANVSVTQLEQLGVAVRDAARKIQEGLDGPGHQEPPGSVP